MSQWSVALNRSLLCVAVMAALVLGPVSQALAVEGAKETPAPTKPHAAKTPAAKAIKPAIDDKAKKSTSKAKKGAKKMKVGNMEFDVKTATLKTSLGTINLEFYSRTDSSLLPEEVETKKRVDEAKKKGDDAAEKKELAQFERSFNANVNGIATAAGKGHYNGRIVHRVIDGFMIQLGLDQKLSNEEDKVVPPAKLESQNGLKNVCYAVAMARTNDPNSATTQFFINLKDNAFLDYAPGNPGYTVVGKVVGGQDVVDKIAKVTTGNFGGHGDVPKTPIIIESFSFDK
jgi:cyclophilin family peptidyl-prolyl cis-trans isomerase